MRAITIAVLLASTNGAHASVCEDLSKGSAESGLNELRAAGSFVTYCPTCDGGVPSAPVKVGTAAVRSAGGGYELVINGVVIEIAHAYIPEGDGYRNLGLMMGCTQLGMPTHLVAKPARSGVVILPGAQVIEDPEAADDPPPPQAIAPQAPATYVPPREPAFVIVRGETPSWYMWCGAVFGAIGCGSTIGLSLMLAARARRRRALLPRAATLISKSDV
jgi:hypothetical protein